MTNQDPTNLRQSERKPVGEPIRVINVLTESELGKLGNLSAGGMMLICNRQLNDDAIYQLRFTLPAKGNVGQLTLNVGVHERWTQAAADPGRYWSGVRFIDIAAGAEEQLEQWLASL